MGCLRKRAKVWYAISGLRVAEGTQAACWGGRLGSRPQVGPGAGPGGGSEVRPKVRQLCESACRTPKPAIMSADCHTGNVAWAKREGLLSRAAAKSCKRDRLPGGHLAKHWTEYPPSTQQKRT